MRVTEHQLGIERSARRWGNGEAGRTHDGGDDDVEELWDEGGEVRNGQRDGRRR